MANFPSGLRATGTKMKEKHVWGKYFKRIVDPLLFKNGPEHPTLAVCEAWGGGGGCLAGPEDLLGGDGREGDELEHLADDECGRAAVWEAVGV